MEEGLPEFGDFSIFGGDEDVNTKAKSSSSSVELTDEEINVCTKILKKLSKETSLLENDERLRELRRVGREVFVNSLGGKFFGMCESKEEFQFKKQARLLKKHKKNALKLLDKRIREKTEIRKMEEMQLVDGQLDSQLNIKYIEDEKPIDENCEKIVNFLSNSISTDEYLFPKSCYTCKTRYFECHHYYDLLCKNCADLNWEKRNQRVDMKGRIAIVTGGRVKIGFQTVLKLLRDGAEVIVTTRFPQDAAKRYIELSDFSDWKLRLHIYGLDLRDLTAVEKFTSYIMEKFDHLDMIINNASQTVRRPTVYYKHLMEDEFSSLPPSSSSSSSDSSVQSLLCNFASYKTENKFVRELQLDNNNNNNNNINNNNDNNIIINNNNNDNQSSNNNIITLNNNNNNNENEEAKEVVRENSFHEISIKTQNENNNNNNEISRSMTSSELSQIRLIDDDFNYNKKDFPEGILDINKQQIDLRIKNSWTMKLHEISTIELIEVHAINSLSPFILNSKLKEMLIRSPFSHRFIVNVSAMEGKFTHRKTANHPHTNMAKASSNMMTRTSASDYVNDNIYMNSVDTGWITDENPFEQSKKNYQKHSFQPPIDEIDAAARILDPIYSSLLTNTFISGVFFKDYHSTQW